MTALDLAVDPPPDLAIEVDVTRSVMDRLGVYAALRVPEVWRFDGQAVEAYTLATDGRYERIANSAALPFLPLDELGPLVQGAAANGDDAAWFREVQTWLRERVLPRRQPPDAPPGGAEGQAS